MNISDFKTVDSLPALFHPEMDLLVISDLHLGLEGSMTHSGNYVPEFQLDELKEDLREARELTEASRILVNGDLKHEFSTTRYAEKKEIESFVNFLSGIFEEVIVVEGNHDTFIQEIVEENGGMFVEEYREDGILFVHGHEELPENSFETAVIGHEHPALVLKDEIGVKEKVDAFLHGKTRSGENIIVMPAFSKISGGSRVNQVPKRELLSPVLRNQVEVRKLRAVAVSREAGLFEFPEIGKL